MLFCASNGLRVILKIISYYNAHEFSAVQVAKCASGEILLRFLLLLLMDTGYTVRIDQLKASISFN